MGKNFLIINAHWNNRGDESALRAMIDSLHSEYQDATFYVQLFTDVVEKFPKAKHIVNIQFLYPRKRAFFELPLLIISHGKCAVFSSTKEYIKLIKKMDLIIHAPGGPSIGDLYKHAELLYLMKFITAKAVGIPYLFYAPSMGPFQDKTRNILRKYVLNNTEMLSVRETVSEKFLKELGIKKKVHVTLDAAIQKEISEADYYPVLLEYNQMNTFLRQYNKVIGVTITELEWQPSFKNRDDIRQNIRKSFHALLSKLEHEGYGVIFIPQLFGRQNDKDLMIEYAENYSNTLVMDDSYDCYFQQYIIGKLYMVVGMRYHSNIFSAKMGTPFLSIAYEQKMTGFIRKIDLDELCIQVNVLDKAELCERFDFLINHYDLYKDKITKLVPTLIKESHHTTELVILTLNSLDYRRK